MPITQDQMLEQMHEARAAHAEMLALRNIVLNYANHVKKTYPNNDDVQQTMTALEYTVSIRPIPTDRATYVNEKYYARFAKRNASAKQRQALIRAGAYTERPRKYRKRGQPGIDREAVIMPREYPDDKPLEMEKSGIDGGDSSILDDLANNSAASIFSLDTTLAMRHDSGLPESINQGEPNATKPKL